LIDLYGNMEEIIFQSSLL